MDGRKEGRKEGRKQGKETFVPATRRRHDRQLEDLARGGREAEMEVAGIVHRNLTEPPGF